MSSTHARPSPDACSVGFDRAGVSAYGTAARAQFFIALEQAGPWGREAATQSHLPEAVGSSLSTACSERGGRLSLIRRPGRHADDPHVAGHTAYLAWSGNDAWLLEVRVDDPAALLQVDLDALARGDRDAVASSVPGAVATAPILLVCTNGRRDVCCAVRGRPVALDAAAARPGRVWEASHTGGHRFAPTAVLLPHGATFARLDGAAAVAVLDASDHSRLPVHLLGPVHDRGRSCLGPGAQAAESHVRQEAGITDIGALTTSTTASADGAADADTATYTVSHGDGRRWLVWCERRPESALPESCGKSQVPVLAWHTRTLG